MECSNRCTITTLGFFTISMMYIMKLDPDSQKTVFNLMTREQFFLGTMFILLGYLIFKNLLFCSIKK